MADARTGAEKFKAPALAALLAVALVYLLTAFVLWEFNPGAWSGTARFFTACLSTMVGALVAAATAELA